MNNDIKLKVLVAYHNNCLDGITSAAVCVEMLENLGYAVDTIAMDYTEDSINKLTYELTDSGYIELLIVDYSVPIAVLDSIHLHVSAITILDHHKTAFENYMPEGYEVKSNSYEEVYTHDNVCITLNNAQSGAGMCWSHFNTATADVPNLIRYVQDYDIWKFEYGNSTKYMNKFLTSKELTVPVFRKLLKDLEDEEHLLAAMTEGKRLQEIHDREVAKLVANAIPVCVDGHEIYFVECPKKLCSDVGHELSKLSGTFSLTAEWPKDTLGMVTFSLRSVLKFDVSVIAKKYSGGGHKNAAGFTMTIEAANIFLSYICDRPGEL